MKSNRDLIEIRCSVDDRIMEVSNEAIHDGAGRYQRLQGLKAGATTRLASQLDGRFEVAR